ncbi:helix-turn-helix domain-containing protein [Catenulispora subtropica]|uniref:Helix-turn-helix domain-containing protein n=1 Tax=Catenulispora subtropica TaxID=450798 RepID=A0ABP5EMG9_9ACTN
MPEKSVRRLDARSLRALAHPLRMSILDALKADGPATSTTLAQRLGESTGTLSWHLRHLAEHGFIEEDVERGTKRERWWRTVDDRHQLDPGDVPEEVAALNVYMGEILRHCFERAGRFLSESWSSEWQRASTLSDWQDLRLAPEQLAELNRELLALVNRYADGPQNPDGLPVTVQIQSFPRSAG